VRVAPRGAGVASKETLFAGPAALRGTGKGQPAGEPRSLGPRSARSRGPGGRSPKRKRGEDRSAAGGRGAGLGGRLRALRGRRRGARGGARRGGRESRSGGLLRRISAEFASALFFTALGLGGRGVCRGGLLAAKTAHRAGRRRRRPRGVLACIGGGSPEALTVGVALREIVSGGADRGRRSHRAARQERHTQDGRCDLLGAHRPPRSGRSHAGPWTGRLSCRCTRGTRSRSPGVPARFCG
jgi:hypothetical protein